MRAAAALAIVCALEAIAQAGAVAGRVVDRHGAPIAGATVSVADRSATTGDDGRFRLDGIAPGSVAVLVLADGFDTGLATVRVGDATASVDLRLTASKGEVVEVNARAPVKADPETYTVTGDQVRTLPGSGNDALKALQSLPGVSRVPFGLAGLVLRGAAPRDSKVYLDGIQVPLLYHFGGLASFYPSALIDDIDVEPGSYSAAWGRSQGGVVLLTGRGGRGDRWRISSEVSLMDAQVRAEGPAPAGGAWEVGLRRSYLDAVLGAVLGGSGSLTILPAYYDGQVRYDRGSLTALLFFSDDTLRFAAAGFDPNPGGDNQLHYDSGFVRAGVRYKKRGRRGTLTVTPWVGYNRVSLDLDGEGGLREYVPAGLRADVIGYRGRSSLAAGLDLQGGYSRLHLANEVPPTPGMPEGGIPVTRDASLWSADLGAWIVGDLRIGPAAISPSLRLDRYGLSGEWVLDPRLSYAQGLSKRVTMRAAIGVYHQPPIFADVDPALGNRLRASHATQVSLGVDVALPDEATAAVTVYSSQLTDLPVDAVTSASARTAAGGSTLSSGGVISISRELADEQFGSYSYQQSVGRGDDHGVELLIKRLGVRWAGWLSYTWSRSLRTEDPAIAMGWHPYLLDQPNVLTALGTVQLGRWRLGGRIRYATGNPITPVAGTYYDVDQQRYEPIDGPLLSARLPAFVQLDLRADRAWKRCWGTIGVYLDVQNVTNRQNAEGVTYDPTYTQARYTEGLPIFPSLGVEYTP